jgi:hypothetical protein
MITPQPRPNVLWTHTAPTRGVERYLSAHRGEFRLRGMKSRSPYSGDAVRSFRELREVNPYEGYHRFAKGAGEGCWMLIKDKIRNNLTADLLAAAEALSGQVATNATYGPAGGYGVDTGEVWVGLLDGGVGVEVHVGQDDETGRPEGWQRTTIRGPKAYRCLLELLGFDWIDEKLNGEEYAPTRGEILEEVNRLLTRRKA